MQRHIIPLICLLTINNGEDNFVKMYSMLEEDEYLYNILIEQVKTWWNKKIDSLIIKQFINIYTNHMIKDDEMAGHIKNIKELFLKKKNIDIINKILLKECTTKLNIIRLHKIMSNDKKLKLVPDEEYKYGVLTNLNSKEKRIKYTDRPVMDVYSEPKVLMSYALNLYPIYDDCLSPTEHVFYQIVKDKKKWIKTNKLSGIKII